MLLSFSGRSGIIDLDQQGCSLQDGTNVPCVALQYCLTYSGHGVPKDLCEYICFPMWLFVWVDLGMCVCRSENESGSIVTLMTSLLMFVVSRDYKSFHSREDFHRRVPAGPSCAQTQRYIQMHSSFRITSLKQKIMNEKLHIQRTGNYTPLSQYLTRSEKKKKKKKLR